ncbi:hypothetical protein HZA97_03240 [Candidatus Woesearchaeota archaeon]|nr:hypothetical protein [Candidatus Woesearchaeota archaeon]
MGLWSDLKEFFHPITSKFEWFGKQVQKVVNCILLLIVYFVGVAMTAIPAKLTGNKFLNLKPENKKSHWIEQESKTQSKEDYYRMF